MKKPLPLSERYWEKSIKSGIGHPVRIFTELIINSADSYQRLKQDKGISPPHKILVKYFPFSSNANVSIKDDAEGMDKDTLWKKIEYGGAESGLTEGFAVRGSMGLGLKDACMAMENSTITSVKDGNVSEFKILMEGGKPYVDSIREDEEILTNERKKLTIHSNGTVVEGTISKSKFPIYDLKKITSFIEKHYMMRKLLQSDEYEIIIQNGTEKRLRYETPTGKLLIEADQQPH